MARQRAAKRARGEEPSDSAANLNSAASAAESGSGAAGGNPFERLPDELVLRIFSEIEATEAFEKCRLWAVDRRFRRLVGGVHWKELRLCGPACCSPLLAVQRFEQLTRRAVDRLKRGAVLGALCVVIDVGCSSEKEGVFESFIEDSRLKLDPSVENIKAFHKAAHAATNVLSALATSTVPVERVKFSWFGGNWPSEERQRSAGVTPLSCERLARSFLVALSPAASLRSLVCTARCSLGGALAKVAVPGAVPPLRQLNLRPARVRLDDAASIRRAWPNLEIFSCFDISEDALRELTCLEKLRELDAIYYDTRAISIDAALAAVASSPCAPRLRVLNLQAQHAPLVGPAGLSAFLHLRALERIAVDQRSTGVLCGLADLPELRELDLRLIAESDGGAGLIHAAANAIQQCKHLEKTDLCISSIEPVAAEQPAICGLVRAARKSLVRLSVIRGANSLCPELFAELVQGGPKLQIVRVQHIFPDPEGTEVDKLVPLLRLRDCTSTLEGRPNLKIRINLVVPKTIYDVACSIVTGWFPSLPVGPVKVQVEKL